jgi:hypothetical protein
MRMLQFASLMPVVALFTIVGSASAQQPMPGEDLWDLYKLRGRDNCTSTASCDFTYNTENGWNAGALAQSTSLKDCAQIGIETIDGGRYAIRSHLPTLGARTLEALEESLEKRLQSDDSFEVKTWQGRTLMVAPRNIVSMNVKRCH